MVSYGSNPDNTQKGLPRSILMMQLLDATTGVPLAYMSANILSAMRTGATSGVGARHLTIKNPKTVAIIGPGIMSKYTMDAFLSAQPTIEIVKIKGRSQRGLIVLFLIAKRNSQLLKNILLVINWMKFAKMLTLYSMELQMLLNMKIIRQ